MAWSMAFLVIFLETFLLYNWIFQKKISNLQIFLQILKVEQELSSDVTFVIFWHQTWDLGGGGGVNLTPSVSWFSSTPKGNQIRIIKMTMLEGTVRNRTFPFLHGGSFNITLTVPLTDIFYKSILFYQCSKNLFSKKDNFNVF